MGPTGIVNVGHASMAVPVPDADRVAAGMRPRFRQCYQRGLASDPSLSGKLVIDAKIDPTGAVTTAEIVTNTGLSPEVAQCTAGVVKRAMFSAPGATGSRMNIPITFTQQR
jgi:hypothetical protein